jgi:tetratricopeptide (TPR) repeat protein
MNPMNKATLTLSLCALVLGSCGSSRGPYSDSGSKQRNIELGENTYQKALKVIDTDLDAAEKLLREALGYDLYHGSAHNNLGVLFLKKGHLYDAAEEFEWARKLLPGHPEPRINIAITLDRGGKYADALDAARTALEVRPGNLAAVRTLAYIQINHGLTDEQTIAHLDTIVMRTVDDKWRIWAEKNRDLLRNKQLTQTIIQP